MLIAHDTILALADINDEGLFERVAMAVLRIAEPHYVTLSHTGVNAAGKTRKAPSDAFGFVPGAKPPHLVAVHHTTCKPSDLRNKWLLDPATVKRRQVGGKPTAPAGDLIKTAHDVAAARVLIPDLEATLILTWNKEPDQALVCDAKAAGVAHRIDVRIWPGSSLAHILDTTPGGQWIRWKLLRIEQELLSSELLARLSKQSLEDFTLFDDPRAWVPRQLDDVLRSTRRPVSFIAAESGFGKTVACYRAVLNHVEGGGYGLILPHGLVEQTNTLEQAVSQAIRQLHPSLAPGESPLAVCTPDRPLLILVEDINKSGQPERLAAKLARWGHHPIDSGAQLAKSWRLFCPIWPRVVTLMEEQARKAMEPMLISLELMTETEARNAVIARAVLSGRSISEVRANEISTALGNDPLLIDLYDFDIQPDANSVLTQFIEKALAIAQEGGDDTSADFRDALLALAAQMLHRRKLEVFWKDLASWDLPSETPRRILHLARGEKLLRLSGGSTDLRLLFRHDRVRDWFLVEAAVSIGDDLPNGIGGDPFFAEVLGSVIVRRSAPQILLERTIRLNPLGLFHALRECPRASFPERARILHAIEEWLAVPANFGPAHRQLCWEALAALEATDGPEVIPLVKKIPYRGRSEQLARLRNGDVTGGIEMCLNSEPGVRDPLRDRHMEHAILTFGDRLIQKLGELLRLDDLNGPFRVGLLRFAGHLGDPKLGAAIETSWSKDTSRENRLDDYLWAFARTSEPSTAERYLAPVCAAWAALPDKRDGNKASPRDALAANSLRWAFEAALPYGAINYFIARAQYPDLCRQITYMMHGMDEPRATAFIVKELAKRADGLGATLLRSAVLDHWRRAQEEGRPMTPINRRQLLNTWQAPSNDMRQRLAAFDVWSSTREECDISILRAAASEVDFADRVLRQRRDRGDHSVTPALVEKIRERNQGHRWWFNAHHVWNAELSETLDYVLTWRRDHLPEPWGEGIEEDRSTQEIITRLPTAEGESFLLGHWDHLRFSRHFVQAALYHGSQRLRQLAAESVAEAPEPAALFENLSSGWHIRVFGHPGITRDSQVLAVEPYLHLLSESDLFSLAYACNIHGWFDLRRRLFDHRVKRYKIAWSPEVAVIHFDSMLLHKHFLDIEIDRVLSTGVSWSEYLDAMCDWVAERQTFEALQLLAGALAHKGTRDDLSRFKVYEGMPREAAEALISNVTFAVRRRTPN